MHFVQFVIEKHDTQCSEQFYGETGSSGVSGSSIGSTGLTSSLSSDEFSIGVFSRAFATKQTPNRMMIIDFINSRVYVFYILLRIVLL